MDKKDLVKKSERDLVDLAEQLGVELSPSAPKTAMIDKILAHYELLDTPVEEPAILEPEQAKPKSKGEKRYRIIVHNQEGPDNTPFITVSVNGEAIQISRDKEVVIAERYLHALNNAVMTRWEEVDKQMVPRDARRFPFSVLGEVA